jgi:uridine kinase
LRLVTPVRATGAVDVLAHARSHPARLGTSRLVCVDGPSGSGKTTIALELGRLAEAKVVRLDDLYPGWDGLFGVDEIVLDLLRPLAEGQPGHYRRYDWIAEEHQESHQVDPAPMLVLEGVGAGNLAWRHLITTLVWVEAPRALRLERALDRDGDSEREHLVAWMRDEDRLYAEQRTGSAADLVIDTGPGLP